VRAARAENLRIVAVAETHIHADFLSGARELAERAGAKVYVSGEGGPDWKYGWLERRSGGGSYDATALRDGDVFQIGNIEFRALHTPGHTPEHMCYVVTDRGGGATEPMGILTGDFAFVGDVGRPDLLETAAGEAGSKEPAARSLFASLGKFGRLPDYLQVWPAHGAGSACGKALGAVPQSTVGYERRFNAALAAAREEAGFLRYVLEGQPEPPLYFARMKRENRDGPALLGELPRPTELDGSSLARVDGRRVAVLDTRSWGQFREGHVPGALHTPWGSAFAIVAGSYVAEGSAICVIAEKAIVDEVVRRLVRIGLDRVESYATPEAISAAAARGLRVEKTGEIDSVELRRRREAGGVFVLDVRRGDEFAAGRVPGATNVPHTRLAARLKDVPRDRSIVVHCQGGTRSAFATALLQREGYDAVNLAGGFGAWQKAGGAIER
jgi:hydroxyacylglutathione hydrolase